MTCNLCRLIVNRDFDYLLRQRNVPHGRHGFRAVGMHPLKFRKHRRLPNRSVDGSLGNLAWKWNEMSAPPTSSETNEIADRPAHWGGVLAMSLCVFALIASEFMPVSLLTPIASELQVTEGQAGQAIAISGAFAVLTSLFISTVAGELDRKVLLLALTGIMAVSGTIVALAPNYLIFMVGRALIGVVIGGFWAMSAATAMRLVPEDLVPRALAIFNGGNALATVVAPPLGAFLGSIIGWRGAFFTVVPVAVIVFLWQMVSLPSMKAERQSAGNVSGC